MIVGVESDRRCVVVGGGLLGLSAAWSLTRRGWSVVVLEAGSRVGHERSGSKGDARIFRLGYAEPHYVDMALQARELWRSLEGSSGRSLLEVTGQLSFGDPALVGAVSDALAQNCVSAEWLTPEDAAEKGEGLLFQVQSLLGEELERDMKRAADSGGTSATDVKGGLADRLRGRLTAMLRP